MHKRETWIILSVLVFIVLLSTTAYFFSGGNPIKESSAKKRLTAPPGKTRENPMLLVSSKREDTFKESGEMKKTEENEPSPVKNVYSAKLDAGPLSPTSSSKKEKQLSTELQQFLGNSDLSTMDQANLKSKLEEIVSPDLPPSTRVNILRNNLDLLMSKGLSSWVNAKLEEILHTEGVDPNTTVQSHWLLSLTQKSEGKMDSAEQHFQTAWNSLLQMYEPSNPQHQELLRLIGLNYTQFLRAQNRVEQAEEIRRIVEEKIKLQK